MTKDSQLQERRASPRLIPGFAVLVGAFALASHESFHPLIATAKLALAGLFLAGIGRSISHAFGLQRAGTLAIAHDILLGQLAGLAYLVVRSLLVELLPLPGISMLECFAVAGLVWWVAGPNVPDEAAAAGGLARLRRDAVLIAVPWLAWLGWIAFQKLDLHFTPSSDPDIHAFYARTLLERGHIYYDLLPNSDSWMVYPSFFASLNFVWGMFSGLHPVQLVNIAPYVQWTLLAGAIHAACLSGREAGSRAVGFAALHFAFAFLGFNAVLADGRGFLEGTPRLAHIALLLHPLLFAVQQRTRLREQPLLWGIPLFATAMGACVNPTHVPAVLMVGAAALVVVRPRENLLRPIAMGVAIALVMLWADPFYRGLVQQRATPTAERDAALDLTGHAITGDLDPARAASRGLPQLWRRWSASEAPSMGTAWSRRVASVLALVALVLLVRDHRRSRASSDPPPETPRAATTLYGALAVVALGHALWTAITPALAEPGVLQTRLLVQYARQLQEQLELVILAITPVILLTMWTTQARWPHPTPTRLALICVLIGVPVVAATLPTRIDTHYGALRTSPLGEVHAGDVAFAKQVEAHVPSNERVLLPGRTRRLPGEHWVFTIDVGRALPLFSDTRTSFFLGLDGWAFDADAYVAHVAPPRFDAQWLREHEVHWLLDSGQFSPRFLDKHYERALTSDNAGLWRLRGADSGSPAS